MLPSTMSLAEVVKVTEAPAVEGLRELVRLVVVAPLRDRFVGVVGGLLSRLAELGATNRIELQNKMKANAAFWRLSIGE